MNPTVSVIIPNYNHAPFLKERIESVLNQTYQDFEVIILDDYSKDNSKEIIEQYRENPKISHIEYNEINSGSTFKQWQKGFQLARGEFIWIAESDDVADKNFLSEIIATVRLDDAIVLAASEITFIDEKDNITGYFKISSTTNIKRYSSAQFIRQMAFGNRLINASSAVFKKETALSIPDDFTKLKISGDYLFWIEIAQHGHVIEIPKHLDYFRRHAQTLTPKMTVYGIAAQEDSIIFDKISNLIDMSIFLRHLIIGFRIWQAINSKDLKNIEIKNKVIKLWKDKTHHPKIDIGLWRLYNLYKRIINKLTSFCKRYVTVQSHSLIGSKN